MARILLTTILLLGLTCDGSVLAGEPERSLTPRLVGVGLLPDDNEAMEKILKQGAGQGTK